jgi:transcriptional regulator with XRE-family HTH domain
MIMQNVAFWNVITIFVLYSIRIYIKIDNMNDKSYIEWKAMSDKSLMETIGNFIHTNRLNQNKSQDQVAADAGISRSTLSLLERGEKVRIDSLIQVLRVLDLLYVMDIFKIQDQISPIEYARLKRKERKQASPRKDAKKHKEDIGW